MRPEDLKAAEQIVSSLKWFTYARGFAVINDSQLGHVRVVGANFDPRQTRATELALSRNAATAAFAVLQSEWAVREAELRRRAAQIGLVL